MARQFETFEEFEIHDIDLCPPKNAPCFNVVLSGKLSHYKTQ